MTKTAKPRTKAADIERTCPVTGQRLAYNGRGRPPVFHSSVSRKARAEYRAKTGGIL